MGIGGALTKTQRKSWNITWASEDGARKGRLGPDNGKEGQNGARESADFPGMAICYLKQPAGNLRRLAGQTETLPLGSPDRLVALSKAVTYTTWVSPLPRAAAHSMPMAPRIRGYGSHS